MNIELGTCSRLCARISKAQCGMNKKRGTFACSGCTGLVDLQAVEYVPPVQEPAVVVPLIPAQPTAKKAVEAPSATKPGHRGGASPKPPQRAPARRNDAAFEALSPEILERTLRLTLQLIELKRNGKGRHHAWVARKNSRATTY
jgi:hypothetical protein